MYSKSTDTNAFLIKLTRYKRTPSGHAYLLIWDVVRHMCCLLSLVVDVVRHRYSSFSLTLDVGRHRCSSFSMALNVGRHRCCSVSLFLDVGRHMCCLSVLSCTGMSSPVLGDLDGCLLVPAVCCMISGRHKPLHEGVLCCFIMDRVLA